MDRAVLEIQDQSGLPLSATVTGTPRLLSGVSELLAWVDVTSILSSPTVDVAFQVAPTSSGPWATHTSFSQITGVSTNLKQITNVGKWGRLKYTYGGTGAATLSSWLIGKN